MIIEDVTAKAGIGDEESDEECAQYPMFGTLAARHLGVEAISQVTRNGHLLTFGNNAPETDLGR